MIISLEGPRAVGKTTLTDRLIRENNNITVYEGYYIPNSPKRFFDCNSFCENQKKYIDQKIKQYQQINPNEDYMIVRGVEGIEQYSLMYPIIYGYDWNVEEQLRDELLELKKYKSDIVLYLNASIDVLLERNKNDNVKYRPNYNDYINRCWEAQRKSFEKYENIIFLNTDSMNTCDVFNYTMSLFGG